MKKIACHFMFVFMFSLLIPVAAFAAGAEGFLTATPKKTLRWEDAKNFCESNGGRLPLVNETDKVAKLTVGTPVEGFGAYGDTWPTEVPKATYWTGTTASAANVDAAWVVYVRGNKISLRGGPSDGGYDNKKNTNRVLCVPK